MITQKMLADFRDAVQARKAADREYNRLRAAIVAAAAANECEPGELAVEVVARSSKSVTRDGVERVLGVMAAERVLAAATTRTAIYVTLLRGDTRTPLFAGEAEFNTKRRAVGDPAPSEAGEVPGEVRELPGLAENHQEGI